MEKNYKENYVLGILGSLIGAIIATIPWVLMYIYGKAILSALAILVAFGAFYGYKLCHGPINKKLLIIIVLVSVCSNIYSNLGYYSSMSTSQ